MNSGERKQWFAPGTASGDDRQEVTTISGTITEPQPLRLGRQRQPADRVRRPPEEAAGVRAAAASKEREVSRPAPAIRESDSAAEKAEMGATARPSSEGGVLLLAGLLVVTVLFSLILLPPIEAALQLPPSTAQSRPSTNQTGPADQAATSSSSSGSPVTASPTALPAGMSLLAADTFQRPDQRSWGTATDGHPWQGDARLSAIFAISHQQGQLSNGQGAYNAILGPAFSDGEVFFTGAINRFQQANLGAVLRWMDTNNWYKAYIDGSQLVLLKSSGGMQTRLASVPFTAQAQRFYCLRFRIQGDRLQARAWLAGTPEPSQWQVSVRDDTFQSGFGGLRLVLAPGSVITISAFQELALTTSSPAARPAQ
ncbi:MAG: hypothetical protein IMW90_15710 [Thermogemmatispora sp.]|uniref:hypothetical protein n=1 Tax=Thermogemmatispora sp. TaxID=1968838 RepID=UPI0019F98507|nr:hypothetical protein [Thermogemmatispora sp.]MBE3567164.1 hypothetical protein [Thermogemmatispora sp.]